MSKMIALLGATYDQYLSPQVAVLVCGSNKLNLDKIAFAKDKGIPSVKSSWLWACVDEARLVDVSKYSMPQPDSRPASLEATATLRASSHIRRRYDDSRLKTSSLDRTLIQLGHQAPKLRRNRKRRRPVQRHSHPRAVTQHWSPVVTKGPLKKSRCGD